MGDARRMTKADLDAMIEDVRAESHRPCGTEGKPHIIHPDDLPRLRSGEWVRCGQCGSTYRRGPEPLSERYTHQ